MITIELTDGTILHPDDIFYISFSPTSILIKGWKEGLNQTEDEFLITEIKMIRFDREDD